MVHNNMDRVTAEKRLANLLVGDFLLRRRADGDSLALSLRAANAVLHIKLERRAEAWIIGEGPSFRSVGAVLRFYARAELPIRGGKLFAAARRLHTLTFSRQRSSRANCARRLVSIACSSSQRRFPISRANLDLECGDARDRRFTCTSGARATSRRRAKKANKWFYANIAK